MNKILITTIKFINCIIIPLPILLIIVKTKFMVYLIYDDGQISI